MRADEVTTPRDTDAATPPPESTWFDGTARIGGVTPTGMRRVVVVESVTTGMVHVVGHWQQRRHGQWVDLTGTRRSAVQIAQWSRRMTRMDG